MKSNVLTIILNCAMGGCLLVCVALCIQYYFLSRDFRNLNLQVASINARRGNIQAFVGDCVEYSKKNPAIIPILESVGWKPNAPAKPAAK